MKIVITRDEMLKSEYEEDNSVAYSFSHWDEEQYYMTEEIKNIFLPEIPECFIENGIIRTFLITYKFKSNMEGEIQLAARIHLPKEKNKTLYATIDPVKLGKAILSCAIIDIGLEYHQYIIEQIASIGKKINEYLISRKYIFLRKELAINVAIVFKDNIVEVSQGCLFSSYKHKELEMILPNRTGFLATIPPDERKNLLCFGISKKEIVFAYDVKITASESGIHFICILDKQKDIEAPLIKKLAAKIIEAGDDVCSIFSPKNKETSLREIDEVTQAQDFFASLI